MALNGLRSGMLINLQWVEVILDACTVFIHGERMKGGIDYHASLAPMSVELLKEQKAITGASNYVFPNRNDPRKPMSNMAMNSALKYLGYQGRQVSHGFRHVLTTGLNERGYETRVIKAQTAHKEAGIDGMRRYQHDYPALLCLTMRVTM